NRIRVTKATEELMISGYSQILRPKLVLGRFRAPERDLADFLKRLPEAFEGSSWRYALSGGPAAEALQHFYRGSEWPDHALAGFRRTRFLATGVLLDGRTPLARLQRADERRRSARPRSRHRAATGVFDPMTIFTPAQLEDLRDIQAVCQAKGTEIVIIGAMAYRVFIHDVDRETRDIDLAVAIDHEDLDPFYGLLAGLGWERVARHE